MFDFFTNKHVITAMIVAPILAVLAWFVTDQVVGERPHVAQAGAAYPLVAKSNCRYSSGKCTLANNDFKLELRVLDDQLLSLTASHPLQGVRFALVDAESAQPTETSPVPMRADDVDGLRWLAPLPTYQIDGSALQLAVTAGESHYFAETGMLFSQFDPGFNADFKSTQN